MKSYGQYIKKLKQKIRIFPQRQEGCSREEYARKRLLLSLKYGVCLLAAFAVLRGVLVTIHQNVSVSNSVNGRELPIYCVETGEPKVALSFDAAWGNEDTKKILEILSKHDVHVTFFMTGGWVERWAYMKVAASSVWISLNIFSSANGDFAKVAAVFLPLIPTKPKKAKRTVIHGNFFIFPFPWCNTGSFPNKKGIGKPFILGACPCYLRVIQNP